MASKSLGIQPMTAEDYDEVAALWQATEGVGLDDDTDTREGIASCLARNPGLSFVARQDGRITGAVLCGHDGRRGYLHHLAVAPQCRRKGIGRALVEACLMNLGNIGIRKCNIYLFSDNEDGDHFWRHIDWKERIDLKVLQKRTLRATSATVAPRPSPGSSMRYRNATAAVARTLAQMNHQLIRDEGHRSRMSVGELEQRMRSWLEGEYQAVLFEDGQGAAGYALYRREAEWVYVRQFFVRPERRRQGIGRAAWAWLRENPWRDAPRIRLDVLIGNASGLRFWRSLGFEDYCITMERPAGWRRP